MKKIDQNEALLVSGGEQYFVFTNEITFNGIPEVCIHDFYNTHQDSLNSFVPTNILTEIYKDCSGVSHQYGSEWMVTSATLVSD